MKRDATKTLVTLLLVVGFLSFPIPTAHAQDADPPLAPPLRAPDDFQPTPLDLPAVSSLDVQGSGLRAVAIVGDVGGSTDSYKDDMDRAVAALRAHGVTVETFYYGERAFDWRDIVPAMTGAHLLLYMGHGVWMGGTCTQPDLVGGFYLGDDGDGDGDDISFVGPDQIRGDLAGRVADDAVVILSHACYAAGDAGCTDAPSDWPSQAEAERYVRMYAEPFVDAGFEAYFANNYNGSAADYVDQLLAEEPTAAGEIFQSVSPYDPREFRDLAYPDDPTYDLWLSGRTANWNDAFVGIPDYVFGMGAVPQLGPLPDTVTFIHYLSDPTFIPAIRTLIPQNVGSDDPLSWEVVGTGSWFTVTPTTGETSAADATTSGGFTITPDGADGMTAAAHSGSVTVTVTDPEGTMNGVQTIEVILRTVAGSPSLVYLPAVTRR
jgi:hypothetical protein